MTKSPTREASTQANEQARRRNVYDYDGEYEFPTVQHWTAPDSAHRRSASASSLSAAATGAISAFAN